MTQSSNAADAPGAGRPYGPIGLILSIVAISVVTVVILFVGLAVFTAALVAVHGGPAAMELVKAAIAEAKRGSDVAERLDVSLGIASYVAVSIAVLAAARFRGGRDWTTLVAWRDWEPHRHWKLFVILMVSTIAWEVAAGATIEHFYPEAKDWVTVPKETPWIIGFLALAVLFGPIAEELIFRGWLYTSLRASFGFRIAVLATSVLFALAHWESTHLYALAVFPVGLALATIRERTGSIAASITFHAFYNGVASVMLFAAK